MTFRILNFSSRSKEYAFPSICLSPKTTSENFFTVIIGNNGTGKSRFLSDLIYSFLDISEGKRTRTLDYRLEYQMNGTDHIVERQFGSRMMKESSIENGYEPLPSKLIAIATSLSDKFPFDNYSRPGNFLRTEGITEDFYSYLGAKQRVSGSSTRVLMDRAIKTMLHSITDGEIKQDYRDIFEYLNYRPIIKLTYNINIPKSLFDNIDIRSLTGYELRDRINNWTEKRGGFRSRFYQKSVAEYPISYWNDLSKILVATYSQIDSGRNKNHSLLITFYQKRDPQKKDNITGSLSNDYFILEELRKFDLARGPEIVLYKENGGEVGFQEASSGEIGILSTLLGLIPNLTNNSLIIIDEPEISLHPTWQYRYIELIDKIISNFNGCHVIIATHSHFLISDLPLHRSQVIHFKTNNKQSLEVSYIDQETNSLSAEEILLNIFDMPSTRNYFISKEVSEALEILAEGNKNKVRFMEIQSNLNRILPNLKEIDPLHEIIKVIISIGN